MYRTWFVSSKFYLSLSSIFAHICIFSCHGLLSGQVISSFHSYINQIHHIVPRIPWIPCEFINHWKTQQNKALHLPIAQIELMQIEIWNIKYIFCGKHICLFKQYHKRVRYVIQLQYRWYPVCFWSIVFCNGNLLINRSNIFISAERTF